MSVVNPTKEFVNAAKRAKDRAMIRDKQSKHGFLRLKRCSKCYLWFQTKWNRYYQKGGAYKAECPLCLCESNKKYKEKLLEDQPDYKAFYNRKVKEHLHKLEELKRENEAQGIKVTGSMECKRKLI
jgi:hypothetical protein